MTNSTQSSIECNIVYIYVLIDPRDNKIRYVGKTNNLKRRYKDHCEEQYKKDHRANWINKLRSLDLKPIMQVIEECDETTWEEREICWIAYYREVGCDLVNATDGGEGIVGYVPSEETKRKISEANRNPSDETRRKMSEAKKGKPRSEETRRKIGEAQKGNTNRLGKIPSDETRRRMSESQKGKIHDEETRRKISEAKKGNTNMLGKTHSEETKRKMSESAKLAHQRRQEENKRS